MVDALRRARDGAVLAVVFLTVIPVPVTVQDEPGARAAAPAWYGVVGAAIGLLAGGVFAGAEALLGSTVAAVLAALTLVLVTGGLHQDGLADCADGLGVRGDRERRMAVMRDPTVGTFGVLALVLWALLLIVALAQLDAGQAVAALVAAAAIGRWSALLHATWAAPARADGLGSGFAPSVIAVVVAGVTAILLAAVADLQSAGAAALTGMLVAAATGAGARRALGGRTGDTLGATVALTEVAVVLVALAIARA